MGFSSFSAIVEIGSGKINPVPDFFGWPVPGFGTASGGGQSVQRVTETSPPPRSAVISSRDSSTWPRGVYAQELEP